MTKLPPKQKFDATAIADRKAELATYTSELLSKFAEKRGVTEGDTQATIDAIVEVEFEAQ